jgi:DNA (cytosine-5)-methyltransferase 1
MKPRAFLLENVKGLKSHDNGRIYKKITEKLQNEGYYKKSAVLNSIKYGNYLMIENVFI